MASTFTFIFLLATSVLVEVGSFFMIIFLVNVASGTIFSWSFNFNFLVEYTFSGIGVYYFSVSSILFQE